MTEGLSNLFFYFSLHLNSNKYNPSEFATANPQPSEEETSKKMEEMLIESINKPDRATVTNIADITVVMTEDKSWRIKSDDAFLNALMGGLYEATKEIENSFNNAD